jgi:CRP-like cAMP-binding protein
MGNAIETFLEESFLFAGLNGADREIVEEHMYEVHLDKGEVLFNEGDQGDFLCYVAQGSLQIIKQNRAGKAVELAVLQRGQLIGEMAIIEHATRSASVLALEETVLMILTRKGFELLLAQHPSIGIVILRSLAKQMSVKIRELSEDFVDLLK